MKVSRPGGKIGRSESNSQHQKQEYQHSKKEVREPGKTRITPSNSQPKVVPIPQERIVAELWERLKSTQTAIDALLQAHPSLYPIFDKNALINFTYMIYASNANEFVGLDFESTAKICHQMMPDGPDVDPEDIDVGSEDYLRALDFLRREFRLLHGLTERENVVRARRQVTNHIAAFRQMVHKSNKLPMNEQEILETHKILTKGLDLYPCSDPMVKWQDYSGKYRTTVAADVALFEAESFDPAPMMKMLEQKLAKEVAEAGQRLDPINLAVLYSDSLTTIRPFLSGNGQLSRLILAKILAQHFGPGVIIVVGGIGVDRDRYLYLQGRVREGDLGGMEFLVLRNVIERLENFKRLLDDALKKEERDL